jgi:protoporphyrinogen IX oxidase
MTIDAFGPYLLYFKALHVISVIAWMAGLFYLPRLFVYHCEVARGSAESERFKAMEYRLNRLIMGPAMHLAWTFGILLVLTPGAVDWTAPWWHIKLTCVVLMTVFHFFCGRWRKAFLEDRNVKSARFYRIANEAPTLLMIVIVFMVIVQPG